MGIKVNYIRIFTVLLAVLGGAGIIIYLFFLLFIPQDNDRLMRADGRRLTPGLATISEDRRKTTARHQLFVAGVVILVLAIVLLVILARPGVFDIRDAVAFVVLLSGIALVWSQGGRLEKWRTPSFLLIVIGGVLLVVSGLLVLIYQGDPAVVLIRGGIVGIIVVFGVFIAIFPLWVRTSTNLTAAQERQVRDAERANIAAHLHDSVLQTLTLIRGAADNPARVRALALGQERELRAWLYTGKEEISTSFAEAVREEVAEVETTYGIEVDVVTVGDTVPGPAELALVSATSEAVKNAVRHGKPPVSVYCEVFPTHIEVFVKDCGPGFDLDSIPEDRHGIKGSIIGRTERVGGTAAIRMYGSGTEVRLTVPRTQTTPPITIPLSPQRDVSGP